MRRRGFSPFKAGLIAIVVIAVGTYLGFTKDIPFTTPFQVKAVFKNANSVKPGSPVRIAGVAVGKVKTVEAEPGSAAAVVTMSIDKRGLPLHEDARAKIRPRIFLEGNFFVDLQPGTPSAPELGDGDTIKITQTSSPVQLDQVLTALQEPTRQDLRTILSELGTGLEIGAQSFNEAYDDIAPAERDTSIVNDAFLGIEKDRDLRRTISGLAKATEGLSRNTEQLKSLVTSFNGTMSAFAAESNSLRAGIRELGPTLENANSAFAALNDAFPSTRAFAREILPGVRETPATIEAGFPWIEQTRKLVGPDELRGLARDLSPASRDLARFVDTSIKLFPETDLLSQCVTDTILPTGDVVIQDDFSTGQKNFREFAYTLVGLAGEGQNFDGNGGYVHFQPGGGGQTVSLGSAQTPGGTLFAQAFPGLGTQPKSPGKKPPYNAKVACKDSVRPDLNGPWSAKGTAEVPVNPAARRRAASSMRSGTTTTAGSGSLTSLRNSLGDIFLPEKKK